ncbi:MAG TPA: RNA-guided endonuclease TnpB family protein [Isosphaeraceae bacterium]
MKVTLQLQLLPTADQKATVLATMERFNAAASFAAKVGFDAGVYSQPSIHERAYREIRERFGLSAQMAVRAIGKAVESFARDKTKCPTFQPHGAVTYDERILGFKGLDKVSLGTLTGRMVLPLVYREYQGQRFDRLKGQCDLVYRGGKFYLYSTADVPENPPGDVQDYLGVDLGIVNIATTSDGETIRGAGVESVRRKHNLHRKRLQRRGTKGARKKLKRVAAKESRFRRHQNHGISKEIVTTAKRTSRGIALEDLKGIRQRVTARGGDARNRLSGWSFSQLYSFLACKARIAGVAVVTVDPRNTSRTCAACGHRAKSNRMSRGEFSCKACGDEANADVNAARNIRALGSTKGPSKNGFQVSTGRCHCHPRSHAPRGNAVS